ncbi:MAG TPA: LysR family transcriptional regulator [Candidatus Limnocylindrales bacterium]|nr:LysR family transcriptional regulator [Candidatus Limnocylindrales bacterium]
MDIELRHLRVVCAIADAGSVTKAAAVLGLAPPALLTQLGRIERSIGGRLFDRDRHGARPTPLGDLVLARARLLLPAIQGLQAEASLLAGAGQPTAGFRLGATNGPIIGGLVQRLSAHHSSAHVSTYTSWSAEELAGMVRAGRLDYAVIGVCGDAMPPREAGLVWRTVAVDAVCVLMSDRHPAAAGVEVDLAVLAEEQWANAPGDGCFNDCFSAACARAGFSPKRVFETDVAGCLDLLAAGTAVVLCQGTFRRLPGIAMRPIAGTPIRWRHLVGWHPGQVTETGAATVLSHAARAYQEVVDRNPTYASWLAGCPQLGLRQPATV